MRIFSTAFGVALLVLVLSFALSNKQDVAITMWPFTEILQTPLYAVGIVPLAFGFFGGYFFGWLKGLPHRLHAKRLGKELVSLNTKIGELQKSAVVQHEKVNAKRSFWRLK